MDDDPTIADSESLLRRIPPYHLVPDENLGKMRPSSAAFDDEEMSVVLQGELPKHGRTVFDVIAGHENFALVSISAKQARSKSQTLVREETDEEPAHALVVGKKPRSVLKFFSRECVWVIPPPESLAGQFPASGSDPQ